MIRRIPDAVRRRMNLQRQEALKRATAFEGRLLRLRTNEIKRVLQDLEGVPFKHWADYSAAMIEEDYLPKFYLDLYVNVGTPVARETVNNFIGRKSDIWEDDIRNWVRTNAGRKITLVKGTLKEWVRNKVGEAMSDPTLGVEQMNKNLYKKVLSEWGEVAPWQTRRIIQTEALTASSVAGFESVHSLGIPFTKTWSTSGGSNVRDAHAEAEGQTVDADEPFTVGGELMMYPHDDSLGASAANIINCSCTHIALPKEL